MASPRFALLENILMRQYAKHIAAIVHELWGYWLKKMPWRIRVYLLFSKAWARVNDDVVLMEWIMSMDQLSPPGHPTEALSLLSSYHRWVDWMTPLSRII